MIYKEPEKEMVFRGGLGATTYEPHHLINFLGENCRQICDKIWKKHNPQMSLHPLKYARCHTQSLANNEQVTRLSPINADRSYTDFIKDCDRMLEYTARK